MKAALKILAASFPLFVFALVAHAETAPAFSIVSGEQKISISSSTLDSFYGYSQMEKKSLVTYQPETYKISVMRALGQSGIFDKNLTYYHYKPEAIYKYVQSLASQVEVPVVEPELVVSGGKAEKFTPPQDGTKLDVYATTFNVLHALEQGKAEAEMVINKTSPQKSLAELNILGIKELVAEGVSTFAGSPNNRRHNIKIGVEKMTGIIVQPGDEFSFNKYLGEVDGEHGFLPELVIKKTGTVPEFGGGLCQVSSTTFRAAMAAGLPITERRNHAYAVQYYAPQGTDATIYPGVVDLKFKNDTPGALLIWPYFKDKNTLVFDFYGTKDERQVTLEKPIQWDRKADGSMKASWTRVVVKDGETSTSTFKSVYQPPALFHKTEEFASTTIASGLKVPTSVQ